MRLAHGMILVAILAVTACSRPQGDLNLRNLANPAAGPDEFSVLPGKPLEMPQQTVLPTPTPGGSNLTDQNPLADGVAALGGRPGALSPQGVAASDAAIDTRLTQRADSTTTANSKESWTIRHMILPG